MRCCWSGVIGEVGIRVGLSGIVKTLGMRRGIGRRVRDGSLEWYMGIVEKGESGNGRKSGQGLGVGEVVVWIVWGGGFRRKGTRARKGTFSTQH